MNTVVNRILPNGDIECCWTHFANNFDDAYDMLSLYLNVSGRTNDMLFPERREKFEGRILVGVHGSIFFEYDGIVYITISSIESLNKRKRDIQLLIK